jgi:hypothetical protein
LILFPRQALEKKEDGKTGVREVFCRIVFAFLTHDTDERHSTAITITLYFVICKTKVLTHN